jgi:hypothetical protein
MIQNYFDNVKRILGSLISNARAREGRGKGIYLFSFLKIGGSPAKREKAGRSEQSIASKFSKSLEWSGRQDLNLRHPAPKAKRCRFQGFSKHFFYFHE